MSVLVECPAESVSSMDYKTSDLCWFVGVGERPEWSSLAQGPVGSMAVVEGLELPERVEEMVLVPDQSAVEEFMPAGLYPALHDRVHPRYLDAGGDHLQAGVGHQGVEGSGELGVAVADEEPGFAACVFEVHEEVASELHDPLGGGVCSRAQDPDTPGGVFDDGEDVQACTGQGAGFGEVAGEQGVGLTAQESAQVVLWRSGAGGMPYSP
jgi:hypothetical protein